ncbi:MAG: hypothetical protein IRZ18_04095 [Clostridia bacterium]|nr:hypothetical protein [Clostridia bacterium]
MTSGETVDFARLWTLQEVDARLDEVVARLEAIESGRMWAKASERRAEAAARVERLERDIQEWERLRRAAERERRAAEDEAARMNERLYGGAVRSAKEIESVERQIAAARERAGRLETEELEAMERLDQLQAHLARAKEALVTAEQAEDEERRTALGNRDALAEEARGLRERRDALLAEIAAGVRAEYERARRAGRGQALARVHDGVCRACGVELPRTVAQRVQRGLLERCERCQRILASGGE